MSLIEKFAKNSCKAKQLANPGGDTASFQQTRRTIATRRLGRCV